LHNEKGPAIVFPSGAVQYALDGKKISRIDFTLATKKEKKRLTPSFSS